MTPDTREQEENSEEIYRKNYLKTRSLVQKLESSWRKPRSRRSSQGSDSNNSITPQQLIKCLKEAFSSVNSGITGDQLSQILDTSRKRRDIHEIYTKREK